MSGFIDPVTLHKVNNPKSKKLTITPNVSEEMVNLIKANPARPTMTKSGCKVNYGIGSEVELHGLKGPDSRSNGKRGIVTGMHHGCHPENANIMTMCLELEFNPPLRTGKTTYFCDNVRIPVDRSKIIKKPKPNEPCHCGSKKKYKKCCRIKELKAQNKR